MANSPLGDEEIRIRVESMMIPRNLLLDPNADTIEQPLVEITGHLVSVGQAVNDLRPGDRVCGFAPADLSSHMTGPRGSFHLVKISDTPNASRLVAELNVETRAQLAVQASGVLQGESALVQLNELGCAIARLLVHAGVNVVGVRCEGTAVPTSLSIEIIEKTPESLQSVFRRVTGGHGFEIVSAGLSEWLPTHGVRCLRAGGTLIDLDSLAVSLELPHRVGMLVRTDLSAHVQKPLRVQQALQAAISSLCDSNRPTPPYLDVSIADVAWRKLPLSESKIAMTLTFDSRENALPVVQPVAMHINPAGTYLITGGLGGFGRKTAQWLIDHGAKSLVLTSRTGADTADKQAFIEELQSQGVTVRAAACDGANRQQVEQLIADIDRDLAPLVGIYHSAAVIIDQMITEMDLATFQQVMRNKALAPGICTS